MTDLVCNVVEDLLPLICSIEEVESLPGNPRRGHVESIKASMLEFGQDVPIVVRRTSKGRAKRHGVVTKGNHRLLAARELGWTGLAMLWVNEDESRGNARAIADNRTSDLSTNDDADLLAMLQQISEHPLLLDAASYTIADISDLMTSLAGPLPPTEFAMLDPHSIHTDYGCPRCAYEWSGSPKPGASSSAKEASDSEG
jgi:hypothetical protein